MNVLLTVAFLSFITMGPSAYAAGVTCDLVYGKQGETIPRELKIKSPELARALFEGPHGSLVKNLSDLLRTLRDDNLLTQISYSFRSHFYEAKPFDNGKLEETFVTKVNEIIYPAKIGESEAIHLWNLAQALHTNVGRGRISEREEVLLAYLLRETVDFQSFRKNQINEEYLGKDHFIDAFVSGLELIFTKPKFKKTMDLLFKDRGFQEYVLSLYKEFPQFYSLRDAFRLIRSARKFSYKVKNDRQSKYVVGATLLLLSQATLVELSRDPNFPNDPYKNRYFEQKNDTLLIVKKEDYAVILEELLLRVLSNKNLSSDIVDLLDLTSFQIPLPPQVAKLEATIVEASKTMIVEPRAEAEAVLLKEQAEPSANSEIVQSKEFADSIPRDYFEPQPQRSEKKRKKGQTRPRKRDQKQEKKDAEEILLSEIQEIEAGKSYEFRFLRQENFEKQSVVFSKESLEPFEVSADTSLTPFLRAIQYGFTARYGSNGIKKVGTNMNHSENYYEVKPGVSRLRIIMIRDGNQWTAIKTVHKDEVVRFLEQLE